MKNWKTTLLGVLGAGLVLAKSKGWIDEQTSVFVGAVILAVFGAVSQDARVESLIGGSKPPVGKDEK